MNPSQDDAEMVAVWRLTAEQRRQIYDEEKRRIEHSSPMLSKPTRIVAAVYCLGCLLLFCGITNAAIDFWSTHTWKLKPEPEFFESLVEAVVTLIRPFLAVVLYPFTGRATESSCRAARDTTFPGETVTADERKGLCAMWTPQDSARTAGGRETALKQGGPRARGSPTRERVRRIRLDRRRRVGDQVVVRKI